MQKMERCKGDWEHQGREGYNLNKMGRAGLLVEKTPRPSPEGGEGLAMWVGGEGCFMRRKQPVQGPWGRSMPGVYEEQQGNWYIWMEVSQGETGRRGCLRWGEPAGHFKHLAFTLNDRGDFGRFEEGSDVLLHLKLIGLSLC